MENNRPAVFLDRDGVLNRPLIRDGKPYPPFSLAEFELLPGVEEACRSLRAAGFFLAIITNQPDVGRGTLDRREVEGMHDSLLESGLVDRVEVCYDATDTANYKPAAGLLTKIAEEAGVELRTSFFVGDRWRDIDCGHHAGCTTILIDWSYDEVLKQAPHYRVANLSEAAQLILKLSV